MLRIAASHGAHHVRVFGSVARGDATPTSEIDLLVELDPDRSLLDHAALKPAVEGLLGRTVDVMTEKALHWDVRDRVLTEAVAL